MWRLLQRNCCDSRTQASIEQRPAKPSSEATKLISDGKALVDATLSGDPETIAAAAAKFRDWNERWGEQVAMAVGSVVTAGAGGRGSHRGSRGGA